MTTVYIIGRNEEEVWCKITAKYMHSYIINKVSRDKIDVTSAKRMVALSVWRPADDKIPKRKPPRKKSVKNENKSSVQKLFICCSRKKRTRIRAVKTNSSSRKKK